jgi:hypothetical protein
VFYTQSSNFMDKGSIYSSRCNVCNVTATEINGESKCMMAIDSRRLGDTAVACFIMKNGLTKHDVINNLTHSGNSKLMHQNKVSVAVLNMARWLIRPAVYFTISIVRISASGAWVTQSV